MIIILLKPLYNNIIKKINYFLVCLFKYTNIFYIEFLILNIKKIYIYIKNLFLNYIYKYDEKKRKYSLFKLKKLFSLI